MPFFIRKAFGSGPVRFNLSKRGFGVSLGVTGARVGLSSSGQVYTHAGRYGLYHRKVHGHVGGGRGPARPRPSKQVHRVDTGQTFAPRDDYVPQLRIEDAAADRWIRPVAPWALAGGAACVAAGLAVAGGAPWIAASLLGAAGVGGLGRAVQVRRANTYAHVVVETLGRAALPGDEAAVRTARARAAAWRAADDPTAHAVAPRVYVSTAIAATADEILDPAETEGLAWLATTFALDDGLTRAARADAVRMAFLGMVVDHELDTDEEARFQALRAAFGIDDEELGEERATLEHLRRVRQASDGPLEPVAARVDLKRGETCYFEAPGRVLSEKNLQSRTVDGVRHVARGFVTRHEGTLIVTDRRIALVHAGVTAVAFRRITDVEFDLDEALLTVHKKNVGRPSWFTCERPREAAAILRRLIDDP